MDAFALKQTIPQILKQKPEFSVYYQIMLLQ